MEAPGHQLTNTVLSHRSQSRDKHVGDKRVISVAETSIKYNWLCRSLFCCQKEDIKDYLDSLHLFSYYFLPSRTDKIYKCKRQNISYLSSALWSWPTLLASAVIFLRDQGQFCLILHFTPCANQCTADHISLGHFKWEKLWCQRPV